jgi:predicted transcriptional regulator
LAEVRIDCQAGADAKSGEDCAMCKRFRGWREHGDGSVAVCCEWSSDDQVWELMTLAKALVPVQLDTRCSSAAQLADRADVDQVLVLDGQRLAGVVSRGALAAHPNDPVSALVSDDLFALDSHATLGEAVAAMADLHVDCLPVVADQLVVGAVTRRDLRRAGVPSTHSTAEPPRSSRR